MESFSIFFEANFELTRKVLTFWYQNIFSFKESFTSIPLVVLFPAKMQI